MTTQYGYGTGTPATTGEGPWLTSLCFIAERVVTATGRYDLVVDAPEKDFADNGLYYYINKAQRRLDMRSGDMQLSRIERFTFAEDSSFLNIDGLRYLTRVWHEDADGKLFELKELSLEELRRRESDPGDIVSAGKPRFYALLPIGITRVDGEVGAAETSGNYPGGVGVACFPYKGLVLHSYALEGTVLRVEGHFYSPVLTVSNVVSYWTAYHPYVLIDATILEIVSEYENRSETEFWIGKVEQYLHEMIKGYVQEDMEDSSKWRRG